MMLQRICHLKKSKNDIFINSIRFKITLQLKLSVDYPNKASTISDISPLEFLKVENLKRSDYFSTGFYPLNSIIQVVVLSPENTNVSDVKGNIIPTQIIDNEKIPTDITKEGWIFDPEEGQRIQGKYIFGEKTSVNKEGLKFSLRRNTTSKLRLLTEIEFDESIIVVIIITIVAIAAAMFILKGIKNNYNMSTAAANTVVHLPSLSPFVD